MMKKKTIIFVLLLLSVSLGLPNAHARPFYDGKVIKIIVATKPGGGYDYYGRMTARFMQKYLPGSTIIVKNVPGAGHIIGCNEVYHSKPDGLTFGTYNQSLQLAQLVGMKGIKFDLTKMSWLGSASFSRNTFFVGTNTPLKSLEDVRKAKEVKLACGGVGSFNYVAGLLFSRALGLTNITLMTGYHGGEQQMAILRGEADGTIMTWGTFYSFVKAGNAMPLVILADDRPEGLDHVPLLSEVVKDETYRSGVNLLTGSTKIDRFFAGPPGIPADRLQILREAFSKAWQDPETLRMAQKANRPVSLTEGAAVARSVIRNQKQPTEVVELLKEAYGLK